MPTVAVNWLRFALACALLAGCSSTTVIEISDPDSGPVKGAEVPDAGASSGSDAAAAPSSDDAGSPPSSDGGGAADTGADVEAPPTATISGSLFGQTMETPTAVAAFFGPPTNIASQLTIGIASRPLSCGAFLDGTTPGSSWIVLNAVASADAGTVPPGAYPMLGQIPFGSFQWVERSSSCANSSVSGGANPQSAIESRDRARLVRRAA